MCYDIQRTLVIKEYISPRLSSLSTFAGINSRTAEEDIWRRCLDYIGVHVVEIPTDDEGKHEISTGLSLKLTGGAENFYRNIYSMMKNTSDPTSVYNMFTQFFSNEAFDMMQRCVRSLGLRPQEEIIQFRPNFETRSAEFSAPDREPVSLPLLESEVILLKKATRDFAKELIEHNKWCAEEAKFAQRSDSTLDDLLLS